jgi:peptidoglycan/LPS O-acetylase OafA/YrhL
MESIHRNNNLDLLRATAIILVVIYHLFVQWPVTDPGIRDWTKYGQYGVDLFFVLSGWLIGGLYWREYLKFGDVHVGRFWMRRWFRTLPPYYVALLISWVAVYTQRGTPWDSGYLFFIQNFYYQIPYFSVSWSLAVEEHFYLFAPLLLLAWVKI